MKLNECLKKIQNLSLTKRKIIFWAIITTFGLILFALYIVDIQHKIEIFSIKESLKELKSPDFKKELEKLPKFETEGKTIEEIKEDIRETERLIKEVEAQKEQD